MVTVVYVPLPQDQYPHHARSGEMFYREQFLPSDLTLRERRSAAVRFIREKLGIRRPRLVTITPGRGFFPDITHLGDRVLVGVNVVACSGTIYLRRRRGDIFVLHVMFRQKVLVTVRTKPVHRRH